MKPNDVYQCMLVKSLNDFLDLRQDLNTVVKWCTDLSE